MIIYKKLSCTDEFYTKKDFIMKIVHTADWHVGKTLRGQNRKGS